MKRNITRYFYELFLAQHYFFKVGVSLVWIENNPNKLTNNIYYIILYCKILLTNK